MSAPKLTGGDRLVAQACGRVYKPFEPVKIVRGVLWSVAVCTVLFIAAREVDGWLSVALWVMFGLRIVPWFSLGLVQRVKDEHIARLALLTPMDRQMLASETRLARNWGRAS